MRKENMRLLKVRLSAEHRSMLKTLCIERQMTTTEWIRENIVGAYRFREQLREAWESAANQCVMHDERDVRCALRLDHTTHHEDQRHEWVLDGMLYRNGQPSGPGPQKAKRVKKGIALGGGQWEVWCEKCRLTKKQIRKSKQTACVSLGGVVRNTHHFTYGISPQALARSARRKE